MDELRCWRHLISKHKNNSQCLESSSRLSFLVVGLCSKTAISTEVVGRFRCWKRLWASGLDHWWMIWPWNGLGMTATFDNQPFWFY
jgi:hypothetical protein